MDALEFKLMMFCQKMKLEVGNMLPGKPFNFGFYRDLNPKERLDLQAAADSLVAKGMLESKASRFDGPNLALGQAGFDFIYGPEVQKHLKSEQPVTSQTFNFHGAGQNIQIGDHNTQQIVSAMETLIAEIEKANVAPEAKAEAKGALIALMNNPVVSGLLSGVGAAGIAKLLGI